MTAPVARSCAYCKLPMPVDVRADARTCSNRCRQAVSRSRRQAVEWAGRGRRTPADLYRLQLAKADDAPEPMRTRGASWWACRCGTLVAVADTACRFCGCRRPAGYLIDELDALLAAAEL
jgi:hypothetical protein